MSPWRLSLSLVARLSLLAALSFSSLAVSQWPATAAAQQAVAVKQVVCTRRGLDEDREVFIARACRFTLRASSAGGICARKLDGTVILCVDAQAGAEVDLVVPYPPAGSGELQGEIVGASAADIPPGAILPINAATGATASDPAVRFILLDVGVPEFIRAVLEGVGS